MKCPHCTDGKVILFTSISDCEFCSKPRATTWESQTLVVLRRLVELLDKRKFRVRSHGIAAMSDRLSASARVAGAWAPTDLLPKHLEKAAQHMADSICWGFMPTPLILCRMSFDVVPSPSEIDVEDNGRYMTYRLRDGVWTVGCSYRFDH